MVKRKGQDTLIEAWSAVLREVPQAGLLLVGDGPDRKRIERLARRCGVYDSVIFTGSVPWEDVPAHMDAGAVFAMPVRSRWFGLEAEAFGIVFLEAQACGLPVIIGASGGASECLLGSSRGLVLPPMKDAQTLSRRLVDLLREPIPSNNDTHPRLQHPSWTAVTRRLGVFVSIGQ
jgi:phosphatidylinositol alpha-1,6-mannosyltransferase